MRDLVTFYRDRLHLFSETDNWCKAVKDSYLKDSFDESLISSLLDECRDVSLVSPQDYLHYLRKLVSIAFILQPMPKDELHYEVQKAFQKIVAQGFWKEFQLGQALYALGCHLMGLPFPDICPKQLTQGGLLLEAGDHLPDGGIPHPMLNAELSLVWFFLGWELGNEKLISASLKWVHVAIGLFDHESHPFHGIWLRESEYDPAVFCALYSLLFSVSSKLLLSSKIKHLASVLFDSLKNIEDSAFQSPSTFLVLLTRGFEKLQSQKKVPKIEEKFSLSEIDETLGYLAAQQNDISFACTFSGVNTGLGALHKTGIRIVSFGPHFMPLADSDRYGIHRTASGATEPFRDLQFEKTKDKFEIKGWSRLISPLISHVCHQNITLTEPGKEWLFFEASGDGDKITFKSRLSKYDEKHPLYFSYFVSADQVSIEGEEPLEPGTLNRYQGPSRHLIFERGEEKLSITPQMQSKMEVIPLAGSHHFWGADFLIAFPFEEEQCSNAWDIS